MRELSVLIPRKNDLSLGWNKAALEAKRIKYFGPMKMK